MQGDGRQKSTRLRTVTLFGEYGAACSTVNGAATAYLAWSIAAAATRRQRQIAAYRGDLRQHLWRLRGDAQTRQSGFRYGHRPEPECGSGAYLVTVLTAVLLPFISISFISRRFAEMVTPSHCSQQEGENGELLGHKSGLFLNGDPLKAFTTLMLKMLTRPDAAVATNVSRR